MRDPLNQHAVENRLPTVKTINYGGLKIHAENMRLALAVLGENVRTFGSIPVHSLSMDRFCQHSFQSLLPKACPSEGVPSARGCTLWRSPVRNWP